MTRARRYEPRGRRGAAVLLTLVLSAVLLTIFAGTFQTYRILREQNARAQDELQQRAETLRVKRTHP